MVCFHLREKLHIETNIQRSMRSPQAWMVKGALWRSCNSKSTTND
jgi:hypothetical protein